MTQDSPPPKPTLAVDAPARRGDIANVTRKNGGATATTRGNSVDYLTARLQRDAPEIAARIDAFPSVYAAAKEAGIIRQRTALERLRTAWRAATSEERATFVVEIEAQRHLVESSQ